MTGESASQKSKRYSKVKTQVFILDLCLTFIALFAFQIFLAKGASRMAFEVSSNFYAACFIFASSFLGFMYVVGLPLHFASSFLIEHRFGLSHQSFKAWLADEVKSVGLSFALSMGCIQVFYLILRSFPHAWWLIAALAWIFFSIILTKLFPVLLIPLFYKYLPIEDSALKKKIMDLAEKVGISLMDVCQIDLSTKTAKANAALVGLGRTRKVILSDTLMDKFTPSEVESVTAHEFAHFKLKHIWQLLAFSSGITVGGFYLLSACAGKIVSFTGAKDLSDFSIFPALILLMVVFGLVLMPIQNLFSRILEKQADRFALNTTSDAEGFIQVMRKLAEMNLAEEDPSFLKKVFLYDHPPIAERIRMAQDFGNKDAAK